MCASPLKRYCDSLGPTDSTASDGFPECPYLPINLRQSPNLTIGKLEPTLENIARKLVVNVRKNVSIDWTVQENVRAQLRVQVKRILRKYGCPPDKQEKATETLLEQAAVLSEKWAVA